MDRNTKENLSSIVDQMGDGLSGANNCKCTRDQRLYVTTKHGGDKFLVTYYNLSFRNRIHECTNRSAELHIYYLRKTGSQFLGSETHLSRVS
jgi:hypothetical protein